MKTKETWKANGETFTSFEKVMEYCKANNYEVTDQDSFTYKNTIVHCVNIRTKR